MRKNNMQPSEPLSLEQKHARALVQVERFSKPLPGLSPGAEELRLNMLRSWQAALALSRKALEYERPHPDPETEKNLSLYRSLGLPLPTSPSPDNPPTSGKTET
jgi:hypothetical protein